MLSSPSSAVRCASSLNRRATRNRHSRDWSRQRTRLGRKAWRGRIHWERYRLFVTTLSHCIPRCLDRTVTDSPVEEGEEGGEEPVATTQAPAEQSLNVSQYICDYVPNSRLYHREKALRSVVNYEECVMLCVRSNFDCKSGIFYYKVNCV